MNPAVSPSRQALFAEGGRSPIPTNKDCQDNLNVPKLIFTELILSESNYFLLGPAWATHNFLIVF